MRAMRHAHALYNMPRMPRLVVPGLPHHITQRGNYRQPVFISDGDRHFFLRRLPIAPISMKSRYWRGV